MPSFDYLEAPYVFLYILLSSHHATSSFAGTFADPVYLVSTVPYAYCKYPEIRGPVFGDIPRDLNDIGEEGLNKLNVNDDVEDVDAGVKFCVPENLNPVKEGLHAKSVKYLRANNMLVLNDIKNNGYRVHRDFVCYCYTCLQLKTIFDIGEFKWGLLS